MYCNTIVSCFNNFFHSDPFIHCIMVYSNLYIKWLFYQSDCYIRLNRISIQQCDLHNCRKCTLRSIKNLPKGGWDRHFVCKSISLKLRVKACKCNGSHAPFNEFFNECIQHALNFGWLFSLIEFCTLNNVIMIMH